jgi:hypothetical protein
VTRIFSGYSRRPWLACCTATVLVATSCAFGERDVVQQPSGSDQPVAAWEQLVRGAYENKGVAQVQQLGNRWVLNVICDGIHATYIADETNIDLMTYSKGYVNARYHYVEHENTDIRCVQAPCPPARERQIAIDRLTVVEVTPEQANDKARKCE